jgi:hypothetical protein
MASRGCTALTADGRPCGATRRRDVPYCFAHDPDSSAEAAEARRLGGLHRRREKTVALVYDVSGIGTIEEQERLLEIAALDTLALDNSVARSRTLIDAVRTSVKVRQAGRIEERLDALEAALRTERRAPRGQSVFARATRFEERHR